MTSYDIDPAGVKKVLTATGQAAEEFETELKPLTGYVQSAASGCGNSGAVSPALQAFFQAQGARLTAMGQQVSSSITGAAEATNAYVRGDYEMVANCQHNAAQAKISVAPKN